MDMSSKETFTFVSPLRSHPGPSIKLMLRQVAVNFFSKSVLRGQREARAAVSGVEKRQQG